MDGMIAERTADGVGGWRMEMIACALLCCAVLEVIADVLERRQIASEQARPGGDADADADGLQNVRYTPYTYAQNGSSRLTRSLLWLAARRRLFVPLIPAVARRTVHAGPEAPDTRLAGWLDFTQCVLSRARFVGFILPSHPLFVSSFPISPSLSSIPNPC